jgi:hypothetical protein
VNGTGIIPFEFDGKRYQLFGTKRFKDVESKIEEEDPSNPWYMQYSDEREAKKFRIVLNMPSKTTFYLVGLFKKGKTDVKLNNVGEFVLYYDKNGKQKPISDEDEWYYDIHFGLGELLYDRKEWPVIVQVD